MRALTTDLFTNPDRFANHESWREEALALHAQGPIHRVEVDGYEPFWVVIGHDELMSVERRANVFTCSEHPALMSKEEESAAAARAAAGGPVLRTLINMDAPDHPKFRKLTADWFKPASVRHMAGRLDELSVQAVAALEQLGGTADFYRDVARSYPLHVILSLIGLPEEDYPRMFQLTQEMFGQKDPDLKRSEDPEANAQVVQDFFNFFYGVVADRVANPRDDLASVIANAHIDGEPMSFPDQAGYYIVIATAGHDTTAAAMAGGMRVLAEHPEQLALLRANPELVSNAVEEIIRWTAPVRHFQRTSHGQNMIGDVQIEDGERVYLSYWAANLDPRVFDDPLRFDVTRANAGDNIAFGYGVHFCLGAQLARMELRSLFSAIVPRLEHLELDGPALPVRTLFIGGHKSVPIKYTLSPA